MGVAELYPSKYLTADEVSRATLWDKPLRVLVVEIETFQDKSRKLTMALEGVEKRLILNKTNATYLASVWGDDHTKWTGKSLKLVRVKCNMLGKPWSIGVEAV